MSHKNIQMIDNTAIKGCEEKYCLKDINIRQAIISWQLSLFSFEWLDKKGDIKNRDALADKEQEKYDIIINKIKNNEALERPILGLGLHDNIEIGSKREVFLVLAKESIKSISVHVPKSIEGEFDDYLI